MQEKLQDKTLISNIGKNIGSNRNINKVEVYREKSTQSQSPATPAKAASEMLLPKGLDKSIKSTVTVTIPPIGNQKMLFEKYNDEKLAIT